MDLVHRGHELGEELRAEVPEGHTDGPSEEGQGESFGAEGSPDVASPRADASQYADVACAFEYVHRDRVDESDETDRDDE